MTWVSINPSFPPQATAVTEGLGAALDAVRVALATARASVELASAQLSAVDIELPSAALSTAVAQARLLLDALLDSTGVYVLSIPLPKRGLPSIASSSAPGELGSNFVSAPASAIASLLGSARAERLRSSPTFDAAMNPDGSFVGGNAYVVKCLAESLYDAGDRQRPRFEGDGCWGYVLLMAGADDVASLATTCAFFDRLTPRGGSDAVRSARGVTDAVPGWTRADPSGRAHYPVVTWEFVPAARVLQSYDQSSVRATEYAVIRSNDLRARGARSVTDLFATRELREGLSGNFGSKVVKVAPYDGVTTRFVDETADPGVGCYYHVAFRTTVERPILALYAPPNEALQAGESPPSPAGARPVDAGYNLLSSGAEWRPAVKSTQLSVAPDWTRTPSLASLVPGVDALLDLAAEQVRSFESRATNATAQTRALTDLIDRQVQTYTRVSEQVETLVGSVRAGFESPDAGIYATFRTGDGGAPALVADVTEALDATEDPARPPFDNGSEFVVALVVLAVAPNPAPVLTAIDFLRALLSGGDPTDPVVAGIESVLTEATRVEAALLDSLSAPDGPEPVTFNEDMSPRAPGAPDSTCE